MVTEERIRNRLRRKGRGAVVTPGDFADLGSRAAVDQALSRLTRRGTIRRLARGLYDVPRRTAHVAGGLEPPDVAAVAEALTRRLGARLQRSGAAAAHALGLARQAPARTIYYTDAPSRQLRIGNVHVVLRHVGHRHLHRAGTISADLYHALRSIGRDQIDDRVVAHLRARLSDADKARLREDLRGFPGWAQDVMRRVVND